MNNVSISIYLDTRHQKINGAYPLKLRVYNPLTKKAKMYPLSRIKSDEKSNAAILKIINNGFDNQLSLNEICYTDKKLRGTNLKLKLFFGNVEEKANDIAEKLKPFTFDEFEHKMFDTINSESDLADHYTDTIKRFERLNKIGTASNYRLSQKSLKTYAVREKIAFVFNSITPQFLEDYQAFMIDELERSATTVSMYLRALRAVFNKAMQANAILPEQYPFGKYKYTIPTGDKVNKALSKEQLSILWNGTSTTPEQQKAKDFWFLSYYSRGMNIKDIALLKFENLNEKNIEYLRAKTRDTGKKKPKTIVVSIGDELKVLIYEYKCKTSNSKDYVFPILTKGMTAKEQHNCIKNFTRFINQHFQKYAKQNGIETAISTQWARHSFTTNIIRNGASVALASQALNHSDIKTTENYIGSFPELKDVEAMAEFMKF
jgi:integrase/recombinase XerD